MASPLELKVIFSAVDKFVRPVNAINKAAKEAASALKENQDRVKELDATVAKIDAYKKLRRDAAIAENSLKSTNERIAQLEKLKETSPAVEVITKTIARLKEKSESLSSAVQRLKGHEIDLRTALRMGGVDTDKLAEARQHLAAASSAATTNSLRLQAALDAENKKVQQRIAAEKELAKAKELASTLRNTGAKMLAGGAAVNAAAAIPVMAYANAEDSATQLKIAMMQRGGQVSDQFKQIDELATRLGNKLPGTTADYQDMMTMLVRQGMSAKNILGGLGEATAYLAVQLKMPPTAAAEFASKLQDATRTVDKDMMGLMDTIQRTFYLGVDQNNMLQGFSKLSPALSILKKEGADAARILAPLLVMTDQAGMQGEAAGNAFRKIFQMSLDKKHLAKGNAELAGTGVKLDFSDGKGEFGGLEKMYAQLAKLKSVNTQQRLAALKKVFGDDAETLQALTLMIERGVDGYREVQQKMQAQADIQQRVNTQLGTLKNLWDAATGTFTNALVAFGDSIAPELHATAEWIGKVAERTQQWAKENPGLSAGLMHVVKWAGMALLILGGLTAAAGAVLVPLAALKFWMTTLGIGGGPVATALGGIASKLWAILGPIGKVTAAFAAGYAIGTLLNSAIDAGLSKLLGYETTLGGATYDLFQKIKGGVGDAVDWVANLPGRFASAGTEMINGLITGIGSRLDALRQTVGGAADGAVAWVKEKLGIRSPSRVFAELGMHTMAGFEQGIAANGTGPLDALGAITKKLAALGAAVTLAQPALALPEPVTPPAITRAIGDRYQPIVLPAIPPAIRAIVDQHQPAALPGPLEAVRRIREQHLAEPPAAPAAAERTITDRHQPADFPGPLAALRRIIDTHLPIALPAIPEAIRSLIDQHRPAELPGPLDTVRRISDVHQALQLPAPPDAIRHVRDIVGELPEVPAAQREQAATSAPLVIRSQPAAGPAHAAAPADAGGNTYHITINAPAGSDAPALAALVAREIERIEAGKSAQRRSRLRDLE